MTENTLHLETSPYLLQHADNPVHWKAWKPETFAEARERNLPILLSVGYAACHWCHVMAHESFETPDIAAIMNGSFINIKVDREERPDIDGIYQHALMLLGKQGGWPLTMFLTPDGDPFWGGTYFPPTARHGLPAFPDLLTAITDFYATKQDQVADAVSQLKDAMTELSDASSGTLIPINLIDDAAARLAREIDPINGGIGSAPKFPNPSIMELMWRAYRRNGNQACKAAVLLTLSKMSAGGIYDHLGGGYARYSTDERWLAPHFEKMLYDNAQLLDLLMGAWQDTQDPISAARIGETADWILREMVTTNGGIASTIDADSEGVEGKFYIWTKTEIDQLLGTDADLFNAAYDVSENGNWEGVTILNRNHPAGPFTEDEEHTLTKSRKILFDARKKRVHPGWDDKILTDWNGLAISALAQAGAMFERYDWTEAAIQAFAFIQTNLGTENRLSHNWRKGRVGDMATLEDYAFMIRAAIKLYETTGANSYITQAQNWADTLDRFYLDTKNGGYYFTANDAENLIIRRKTASDNATPSGNGILAEALARLYYLTGNDSNRQSAENIITAFSGDIARNLFPLAALLNAGEALINTTQIVIIGNREDSQTQQILKAAYHAYSPLHLLNVIPTDATLPPNHPASGKTQINNTATAYVCVGATCSLPFTDPTELTNALSAPAMDTLK
jgi:uncharacterized protein